MKENKQAILDALLPAINLTRASENFGSKPQGIIYIDNTDKTISPEDIGEYVAILFDNGSYLKINVTADSGAAMCIDVIRRFL